MSDDGRPVGGSTGDVPGSGEGAGESTKTTEAPPLLGPMIGDYRPLRKIGEGGMGLVYEAEQQHPRRPVALKVIHGGRFVSERDVKLFEREAQALARLRHPGIAAIYEAGRTAEGQHFFAMELVRGVGLLDYARSVQGPQSAVIRQRLELVRAICLAVSYAHQRGVIHRDLKPSNILVVPGPQGPGSGHSGAVPEVKILDFGLARITDGDVSVSVNTELGSVTGTLQYMSPEQARGNPDEIDLRSDVYSLGVILYELLTGRLPYDVTAATLPEAVRIICEEPPKRPVQLWIGPGGSASGRATRLDDDLMTITLRALEKDPWRRYQSAAALAEDIERYLNKQPILARPASTVYQLRMLVARHKVGFAFISSLFALLVAFAVAMTVQSARTARERDRALAAESRALNEAETAKRVSEFLVDIFEVSDPSESKGKTVTAREILDRGAARVSDKLKGQPLVQATVMDTLANVYHNLGLLDQSRALLENSLETRRQALGAEHLDVASSLARLGELLSDTGQYVAAEPHLRQALSIRQQHGGSPADVADSLQRLGHLMYQKGEFIEAERLLREAVTARRTAHGDDHPDVADSLSVLAQTLTARTNYKEAEQLLTETLDMNRRLQRTEHTEYAIALSHLAHVHMSQGNLDRTLSLLREALDVWRRLVGELHPEVTKNLNNLGVVLSLQGKYDEAVPLMRKVADLMRRQYGETHPNVATILRNLGHNLTLSQKPREAGPLFLEALRIQRMTFPEDHFEIAYTKTRQGQCLAALGRFEPAESLLVESYPLLKAQLGERHRYTGVALQGIIDFYQARAKPEKAAPYRALQPKAPSASAR